MSHLGAAECAALYWGLGGKVILDLDPLREIGVRFACATGPGAIVDPDGGEAPATVRNPNA